MKALQIKLLRGIPARRKKEMLPQLNASVRLLALSGLRQRHPNANGSELRRRLAGFLLGDVIAQKVYGDIAQCD